MKLFNEALEACAIKINELKEMNPEEFKKYKINQINLSKEEKIELNNNGIASFDEVQSNKTR